MRPFKDNPREYSEIFQLYSFREKNIPAEAGGFYDQPAVYADLMSTMDSAVSDSYNTDRKNVPVPVEEEQKTIDLQNRLGISIQKKG